MEASPSSIALWLGQFHPILVHFPIVLFCLTLLSDVALHYKLENAFKLGNFLIWSGTLIALPTIFTGWEASQSIPADNPNLIPHMTRALILAGYAFTYSIFRWVVVEKRLNYPPLVFISLSLVLVILTSTTAEYGGVLARGFSPFR